MDCNKTLRCRLLETPRSIVLSATKGTESRNPILPRLPDVILMGLGPRNWGVRREMRGGCVLPAMPVIIVPVSVDHGLRYSAEMGGDYRCRFY